MKQLRSYINIRKGKSTIEATNDTIYKIVKAELDRLGHDADLNHIDVSRVTDMYSLFSCTNMDFGTKYKDMNPDVSGWDVSNVQNMTRMFKECSNFNCDLSQWDVSNVENMRCMFYRCRNFNQSLSEWIVSKVEDMNAMFCYCDKFNQDLSQWDVSNVKDMKYMFYYCEKLNQDFSKWDVSNVESILNMFEGCTIKEEFKPKFKK